MSDSNVLEVLPRDLSAYRKGNVGVDYVHRFESGKPGPHVLINALTHGNEFCGMTAATDLLDRGVRPLVGTLTVSFSNVAAYESFDPAHPFQSRQLVHNFNRIWSEAQLSANERSPELDRARALAPIFAQADHLLDLHSTSQEVEPFWVYPAFDRNARAAVAVGIPRIHLSMPKGLGSGVPIIQFGRWGLTAGAGVALVAECGQHFLRASGQCALQVTNRFLTHFGLVAPSASAPDGEAAGTTRPPPARRFELLQTCLVKTPSFRFTGAYIGFESFKKDALIAIDGNDEIRAPCDECTILMPTRKPVVGNEAVYLAKPIEP